MEERGVHFKCVGRKPRTLCTDYLLTTKEETFDIRSGVNSRLRALGRGVTAYVGGTLGWTHAAFIQDFGPESVG